MEGFSKVVNEKGELVLVRTPHMQDIMNMTYAVMPIIAVMQGSIEGAWHYAITDYLRRLYSNPLNRPWIDELIRETGVAGGMNQNSLDKCAELILNSKIIDKP